MQTVTAGYNGGSDRGHGKRLTATFDPIGWCSDMVGANFAGISKVFGDEAEIKSCEFHFKDHRNKKAQKLNSKSNGEFKQLCDRLLPSLIWTSMSPPKNLCLLG